MVNRIALVLEQTEYSALLKLCENELRNPPDQVQHVLREELKRRGLLPNTQKPTLSNEREGVQP